MNNLEAIFVDVDGFCQRFLPAWQKHLISSGLKQRNKPSTSLAEKYIWPITGKRKNMKTKMMKLADKLIILFLSRTVQHLYYMPTKLGFY